MSATPGPWKIPTREWPEGKVILDTRRTHNSPNRFWETSVRGEPGYVANSCGATQEEAEANAHLIAAAPELLAALKELRCWVRGGVEGNTPLERGAKCEVFSDVLEQVTAAIAKAEGKRRDAEARDRT